MRPHRAIASFDSASAFLRVLGQHLRGTSSPALGLGPLARTAGRLLPVVNRAPPWLRQALYSWSGWTEAIGQRQIGSVDTEAVARWARGHYPSRRYPAVIIGSSSGALTHLAALAGVPWLPQTFLVPVRHGGLHPDRPRDSAAALAEARDAFTKANPGIALHHMHDANQDRLMIRHMAYFRFKYQRLPDAYAEFLRNNLVPNGTVLIADCAERWPTTSLGSRQLFQHGAVGGLRPDEYVHSGPRVARLLAESGSPVRGWDAPEPDTTSPEAEWGFDEALVPDLDRLCARHGWRLERLTFPHADALSEPVAELYRGWYSDNGVPADRLLVTCFALIDAHLPLTRGLVPYWTVFGTVPAYQRLDGYLRGTAGYRDIRLGVFSHGIQSIGSVPIGDWDRLLGHASAHGGYAGVDRAAYPQDFASNVRFHDSVAKLPSQPVPAMPWSRVQQWLGSATSGGKPLTDRSG